MFLDKLRSVRRTLVFRLTVWYAGIFTLSSLLAFFFFYLQIRSTVRERTDAELVESIEEFSALLAARGMEAVKQALLLEARDDGEDRIFYRLLGPDGKEVATSNLSSWGRVSTNRAAWEQVSNGARPVFETLTLRRREHKVRSLYGRIGPDMVLHVGWSLEDDDKFVA
ncbi:MAG: hypothetical protein ACREP8_05185, partial [Candidatus Binatia bacterium]